MKGEKKRHYFIIALLTAALLVMGFFLLIIFGANSYRSAVMAQEKNAGIREQLSAVSAVIRSGDVRGQIAVTEGKYGQMLEVTDGDYTLRLYRCGNSLMEEYVPAGQEPDAEHAETVGTTETFSIEQDGSLLTICTDEGQAVLNLRSTMD